MPVIMVDWDDAHAYTAWLSRKTGKRYCLPSEAEWEYAARAGTRTYYWWGDTVSWRQANFFDLNEHRFLEKPVPVRSYKPNPWGLYQVHGNVDEWVEDCMNENYTQTPVDGSAWSPPKCSFVVVRGGGWNYRGDQLIVCSRGRLNTDSRYPTVGFRVVRDLP